MEDFFYVYCILVSDLKCWHLFSFDDFTYLQRNVTIIFRFFLFLPLYFAMFPNSNLVKCLERSLPVPRGRTPMGGGEGTSALTWSTLIPPLHNFFNPPDKGFSATDGVHNILYNAIKNLKNSGLGKRNEKGERKKGESCMKNELKGVFFRL